VSVRLFFATDVHGSEACWRKFINSGKHYGANVLILGGDMTGKAVVPIIDQGSEKYYYHMQDVRHEFEGQDAVGKDVAMHVAFAKPRYLAKEDVPGDVIAAERAILEARANASGKPAEIAAKMVEGGVNKFLAEATLLGQPFVKDDKVTVGKMLAAARSKVLSYRFIVVGEGMVDASDAQRNCALTWPTRVPLTSPCCSTRRSMKVREGPPSRSCRLRMRGSPSRRSSRLPAVSIGRSWSWPNTGSRRPSSPMNSSATKRRLASRSSPVLSIRLASAGAAPWSWARTRGGMLRRVASSSSSRS